MTDIRQPLAREIDLASVLAALSDPARLAIIKEIHEAGELCAAALKIDLCKSTVSHHMKVLREAGVTWTECEGAERRITLRYDCLGKRFPGLLESVLRATTGKPYAPKTLKGTK